MAVQLLKAVRSTRAVGYGTHEIELDPFPIADPGGTVHEEVSFGFSTAGEPRTDIQGWLGGSRSSSPLWARFLGMDGRPALQALQGPALEAGDLAQRQLLHAHQSRAQERKERRG